MAKINPKTLSCMPNGDFEAQMWLSNFATGIADAADVRDIVGISDAVVC